MSDEQISQIVESDNNRVERWEPKEAYCSLHTQVVGREIWIARKLPTTDREFTVAKL